MYGLDSMFWINFFLGLAIIYSLIAVFNIMMRRILKVEKTKFFSYDHVNEKHKKIDWTIRISFVIILFISGFFIRSEGQIIWYLEGWFLMLVFLVVSEITRAFMEWKYASNRNKYILTISQLVFVIIVLWITYISDFFGLI